jgi:ankyrin repeat protein
MGQVLLDYGVDVNAQSNSGYTPLHSRPFRYFNDPRFVRLLLDHGADPNIREREDGNTPLHLASQNGRTEIARLLVEHGASVEVQDNLGRTPLDVASWWRHDEIIKLLTEYRTE